MKKDNALLKKDLILINRLEADKNENEENIQTIIKQMDETKEALESIEPQCNYKRTYKWATASAGLFLSAVLFSSMPVFGIFIIAAGGAGVSFGITRDKKIARARLENEIKDREDGLVKLVDEHWDIRYRLAEAKPLEQIAELNQEEVLTKLALLKAKLTSEDK